MSERRAFRVQVLVDPQTNPELFEALAKLSARRRAPRLRVLAEIAVVRGDGPAASACHPTAPATLPTNALASDISAEEIGMLLGGLRSGSVK